MIAARSVVSASRRRSSPATPFSWSLARVALVLLLALSSLVLAVGCSSGDDGNGDGSTTTSINGQGSESGDIRGAVGTAVEVGEARVTVRALQATFQPAMPAQRLSEDTPLSPDSGESFYQAYVRVENSGVSPVRVDPNDFACMVGDKVVRIDPTRSGPLPRSLLKNTSLDLVLTFKARAGFEPELVYSPPWYDGTILVSPQTGETTESS